MEENKDYTVAYSNNVKPGTATVKVTGLGEYKDNSYEFSFEIEEDCGYGGFYAEMHQNGTDLGTFDWTGSDVQPYLGKILCKHCNKELEVGNDYVIEYSNNIDPGKATMKVTGIGKYKGYEQSFTYTIGHKTFTVENHKNGDSLGKVK